MISSRDDSARLELPDGPDPHARPLHHRAPHGRSGEATSLSKKLASPLDAAIAVQFEAIIAPKQKQGSYIAAGTQANGVGVDLNPEHIRNRARHLEGTE